MPTPLTSSSPHMNDLPTELLGRIFDLTLSPKDFAHSSHFDLGQYRSFPTYTLDYPDPPFVFLQVCKRWRAVAKHMPFLWNSIDASLSDFVGETRRAVETLEQWLLLSRSVPLDFCLEPVREAMQEEDEDSDEDEDQEEDASSAHAVAMLQTLAREAHRWRSVALGMDPQLAHTFTAMILQRTNKQLQILPQLTHLEIVAFNPGDSDVAPDEPVYPVEALARAIGGIPSLRELYLIMELPQRVLYTFRHIPWHQLTTVQLGMALTVREAATLLAQMTAAERVTLECVRCEDNAPISLWMRDPADDYDLDESDYDDDFDSDSDWDFAVAQRAAAHRERWQSGVLARSLPNLKSLSLHIEGYPVPWNVLTYAQIHLPSLEELSVSCSRFYSAPLMKFMERSTPPLRRLVLRNNGSPSWMFGLQDVYEYLLIQKRFRVSCVEMAERAAMQGDLNRESVLGDAQGDLARLIREENIPVQWFTERGVDARSRSTRAMYTARSHYLAVSAPCATPSTMRLMQ